MLNRSDATGNFNYSRALSQLVTGLNLKDAWEADVNNRAYTHHTNTGASRIDRIYISHSLYKKSSILTLAAAFTDHLAMAVRLLIVAPIHRRGGQWKMKIATLSNKESKRKIHLRWTSWKRLQAYYPDVNVWWERIIKKKVRIFYRQEESLKKPTI